MNIREDITELIGAVQTPIRRASGNNKQQIKEWISGIERAAASSLPEILLRAHLAVGEMPAVSTLNGPIVAAALKPTDILRHSKKLCVSTRTVEGAALFDGLRIALKREDPRKLIRLVRRVSFGLRRWLKWVEAAHGNLTESTEVSILELSSFLLNTLAASNINVSGSKAKVLRGAIVPLVSLSLDLSANSYRGGTLKQVLCLLGNLREKWSSSFLEEVLEDNRHNKSFAQVLNHIPEFVKLSADAGRVGDLKDVVDVIEHLPEIESQFKTAVLDIWEHGRGALTVDTQLFIQEYLKINEGRMTDAISLIDPSEGLHISSLATALLSAWEAREESPKAADTYRLLSSVAEKFFNLRVCGEVGSVVRFDSRLHEPVRSSRVEGLVKIIRPWVEWTEGSIARVIVRALVKQGSPEQAE